MRCADSPMLSVTVVLTPQLCLWGVCKCASAFHYSIQVPSSSGSMLYVWCTLITVEPDSQMQQRVVSFLRFGWFFFLPSNVQHRRHILIYHVCPSRWSSVLCLS